MLTQYSSRSSLTRKHSAVHKVYVPASARQNQYLLVVLKLDEAMSNMARQMNKADGDYDGFYRFIGNGFLSLCRQQQLNNVSFIARDKLVRVRYAEEPQMIETQQQLLFFYNPARHSGVRSIYDPNQLCDKLEFLFLATGDALRNQASSFHRQVVELLPKLAERLNVTVSQFKLKDHQHLTYDIFSAAKGDKATRTHGFRHLSERYRQQSMLLPATANSQTFAIARLPVDNRILAQFDSVPQAEERYNLVYTRISEVFFAAARQFNLKHLAIIANGKIPVVRAASDGSYIRPEGELLHLGFDTANTGGDYVSQWHNQRLADSVQLVFYAADTDINRKGYGRFVNQVSDCLKMVCRELGYQNQRDAVMMRFYQHLSYSLPERS
ncbi:hypothetical protein HMF8227_00683 [Saliniradius amylolyticus]|uniref:DUF3083 family protein n=1 Tax=Saliniradius amylolyticus TaxID=2183582 RepID=A0A2S2E0R1_9ALTE|nr:DUF3083 family protein [Saliniradius amylolyticus]AWL11179.1 hypothetical protein HMF8227_00683 [Saliniradius amylolyticus]